MSQVGAVSCREGLRDSAGENGAVTKQVLKASQRSSHTGLWWQAQLPDCLPASCVPEAGDPCLAPEGFSAGCLRQVRVLSNSAGEKQRRGRSEVA